MMDNARPVTETDLAAWHRHVGLEETRHAGLDQANLLRFAAAVGSPLDVEAHLPPLAHWAFFPDISATEQLGPDGHPRRGTGLLPPIHLPRRMFASASMRFIEPLTVGEAAVLRLRLAEIKHKSGAQGDLVFIEIDRELTQSSRVRVTERQTIAYRTRGAQLAVVDSIASPAGDDVEVWTPDAVQLFRFSAATFNAHRIHYDLPYAQGEEGYPDLIVHGPLTATKVFAFAQKRLPGPVRGFEFRVTAPLFVHQPVRLRATKEAGRFEAVRCDGVVALSASVSC